MSACPSPKMNPPSSCPRAATGLMTVPTSATRTASRTRRCPVSRSTSTSRAYAYTALTFAALVCSATISSGAARRAASANGAPGATSSSFALSLRAASSAAPPCTGVTRLPPMPASRGVFSVVPRRTVIRSSGIPSSAATIRWKSVCCPPPWSATAVSTPPLSAHRREPLDAALPVEPERDRALPPSARTRAQRDPSAVTAAARRVPPSLAPQRREHLVRRRVVPHVALDVDLAAADGVALAELERVEPQLARDEVDVRLGREHVLRLARRAGGARPGRLP